MPISPASLTALCWTRGVAVGQAVFGVQNERQRPVVETYRSVMSAARSVATSLRLSISRAANPDAVHEMVPATTGARRCRR
jgi:hypothetical protein